MKMSRERFLRHQVPIEQSFKIDDHLDYLERYIAGIIDSEITYTIQQIRSINKRLRNFLKENNMAAPKKKTTKKKTTGMKNYRKTTKKTTKTTETKKTRSANKQV